jgi:hypothetical protein
MATIQTVGGENRLIVGSDRFARQPSFMLSTTWTKMRIGLRMCMSDSGASATSCSLHVGISKGNTSIFGDAGSAPAHWIGCNYVGNFNTFVRAASPVVQYGCSFVAGEEWVNGVLQIGTGGSGDMEPSTWVLGATDSNRTCLFVDITKNIGGWVLQYFRNTDTSCPDVSKATFDAQVVTESPTVSGHSLVPAQTWGIVNEATNGYFDHVNLNWNHASPTFKISDITLVKFA